MENEISIRYDRGGMIIDAEQFFPTSKARISRLLKTIQMDAGYVSIIHQLEEILESMELNEKHLMATAKRDYPRAYDRMSSYKSEIDTGKYPNGVSLTRQDLKDARMAYGLRVSEVRLLEQQYRQSKRKAERLAENLAYIREKTAAWDRAKTERAGRIKPEIVGIKRLDSCLKPIYDE
jgi:hypothetical protein